MRHCCLNSAALLLALVVQTPAAHAAAKVLFSDDFEQHAVGSQLGTRKPVVRGEPQSLALKKTRDKLQADQRVKVVCLGDSVTGIYYHTGGRRAYPEMLELALRMTYPKAEVTVVNAGISGNKTHDGLNRLEQKMIQAQHLNLITRHAGDRSPPDRILEDWLRAQLTGK